MTTTQTTPPTQQGTAVVEARDLVAGYLPGVNILNGCSLVAYPGCLLYTSPSPRDGLLSRMPSSA